jgi:hypothetical protein
VRDFYVKINDLVLFIKCVRKDLYTEGKCSVRVERFSLSLSLSHAGAFNKALIYWPLNGLEPSVYS